MAPERDKKAYRMRCAFTVPSGTRGRLLEKAVLMAGAQFVRDMQSRGYEWRSEMGYKLDGPHPHIELVQFQSKAQQSKITDMDKVSAMVQEYPKRGQTADEDWRLTMTFVLPEVTMQTKEDLCR